MALGKWQLRPSSGSRVAGAHRKAFFPAFAQARGINRTWKGIAGTPGIHKNRSEHVVKACGTLGSSVLIEIWKSRTWRDGVVRAQIAGGVNRLGRYVWCNQAK